MKKTLTIFIFAGLLALLYCSVPNNKGNAEFSVINNSKEDYCPHDSFQPDSTKLFFPEPSNNNCVSCHQGIEPIRNPSSGMMQEIYKVAAKAGFKDNECIVCHGGNPNATNEENAHNGTIEYFTANNGPENFYPNPSSVWINDKTCGMCHKEQVSTQFTSLMFTEAGKIQGTTWGFGGLQGYNHDVANVAVEELAYHERLGSETYKKYMEELKKAEPQVYPGKMKPLPPAPSVDEIEEHPEKSVYTYLRSECQRCHTGIKGHEAYGDFRSSGCGSCHIPYSNKGLYEGNDPTIDKSKAGKLLVHSIQSSRDAPVTVHGKTYSGVPTKTCTACHNRGRRIGVSYEGLMETSYSSPFMSNGDNQQKIHKKNYLHLKADVHLDHGMVCQDCHTSGDLHSLGDLSGAIQGAVEIECTDCHGTPDKFPWELPIGYGDEITSLPPKTGAPRGTADSVPHYLAMGWVAPKKDGYLISSRGNPMTKVVKTGDSVIVHSSGGKDLILQPLKKLNKEDKLNVAARVAMCQINDHIDKMECFSCHATWAPQCYGCHIKIDYSELEKKIDWVEVARDPNEQGQTMDKLSDKDLSSIEKYLVSGKIQEQRSYLRWEDPPLVINGDHRVSPAIPGCQTTVTVIDKDGNPRLLNHIFKIPHAEGADEEGQLAIDMAPLHPHTTQKKARSCESCHTNEKSMGYGINGGELYMDPSKDYVMDLKDINGNPIPHQVDTHFKAIPNLKNDWSMIIDKNNKQVQTVGHHFSGSRALNENELSKLDRRGVCLSCHEIVPEKDLASDLLSHVAKYSNVNIDNNEHQNILKKSIRFASWAEVILMLLGIITLIIITRWVIRKLKNHN